MDENFVGKIESFAPLTDSLADIVRLVKAAVEKSTTILGEDSLFENGRLKSFDEFRGVAGRFSHPDKNLIMKVDLEKIEAMEFAFEAMDILEKTRYEYSSVDFLFLEHHLQRLKILTGIIRQMLSVYLIALGIENKSADIPLHTLNAKRKDLDRDIRRNRIVIEEELLIANR